MIYLDFPDFARHLLSIEMRLKNSTKWLCYEWGIYRRINFLNIYCTILIKYFLRQPKYQNYLQQNDRFKHDSGFNLPITMTSSYSTNFW